MTTLRRESTVQPNHGSPPREPLERLLLRVPEAAAMTGIGRSKAYELVASGEWPSVTIGRCVRIPLAGLREWVARREQDGARDRLLA